MTLQGVGASLSPALGGVIAQHFGYAASFVALGGIAFLGLVLWVGMRAITAESCAAPA